MDETTRGYGDQHIIAAAIRRHIAFVLVIAIAFTCAAAAVTLTRHSKYTSTAKVVVDPLSGNPLSPESLSSGTTLTVAMTTEAGIVTSPEVHARAARLMGRALLPPTSAVRAVVPSTSTIVQVKVTSSSAVVAANGAEAYAEAYLAFRTFQAEKGNADALAKLRKQEADTKAALEQASQDAASNSPPPGAATQVNILSSRLATIQTNIGTLLAATTSPGRLITAAVPPTSPDGLNPFLVIAASILLGLGAGVVLAVWRERKDDRIRNAYDQNLAGVPMLATLPGTRRMNPRKLAGLHADDELRTSYRRARAGVIASASAPSVLIVSSVDRGSAEVDPAGEVAANLGWSLTGAGFAVTIIDATIGYGHLAELLGVATAPGLSEQLVVNGASAPWTQESLGMTVVPAGRDPEGAREFYAGARLAKALAWFTEESDYIIVAGPPASTPDGEAVALVGDALLLVVVDKETTHRQAAGVVARAGQLSVRVIGAVGLQRRVRENPRFRGRGSRGREEPAKAVTPPAVAAQRKDPRPPAGATTPAVAKPTAAKPASASPAAAKAADVSRSDDVS